jgi:hypothetical protein|tara:strand:- start:1522 stop:1740 length:219 start_codon:yes stop_codon:yes gene_type:complete
MSNMSYCRFQNTTQDLQDCIDAVDTMINNKGKDEDGETLSRNEENAMIEMIQQAKYFSEIASELADQLYDNK